MMDLEEFSLEPVVEELMPFISNKIRMGCVCVDRFRGAGGGANTAQDIIYRRFFPRPL
jgi:hypothetical protein